MDNNTDLAPAAYQAFHQRQYSKAIELFQQRINELQHVEGKETEIFLLKNDMSVGMILAGETQLALPLLEESLTYFRSTENPSKVAMTLANIATAYEKEGNIKEAIGFYNQALANFPVFDDNDVKYFIHHNLSLLYLRRLKLNNAVLERFKALDYKQHLTLVDKIIQFVIRVVR